MATVRLTIPAESRYLRLARLTAAGIATDLGFDLDSIEDLRVAVDEACAVLVDGVDGAELELSYSSEATGIVIEGRSPARTGEEVQLHPVARELLELTADAYEITADGDGRRFRLSKQRQADGT